MRDQRALGWVTRLPTISYDRAGAVVRDALLVGGLVFLASTFGFFIRSLGFLDTFWPAEALLLGVLVRNPALARPAGWVSALAGYTAAGFIVTSDTAGSFFGGELALALWMTAANLLSVAVGFTLFQQLPEDDRALRRPRSALFMFAIILVAGSLNAVVGGGVASIAEPGATWTGTGFWLANEIVSYMIVLPLVLTAPGRLPDLALRLPARADLERAAPLLALLLSAAATVVVGGPGSVAFPIPALLWCALTYSTFTTVLLTIGYSVWKMAAIATGAVALGLGASNVDTMTSIRLGIMLLALGPLTVASVSTARRELMLTFDQSVNYDYLTGALTRSAFMDRGQRLCEAILPTGATLALLAMDIDQFKKVNDSYGHAAGDRVLVAFAEAVSRSLRPGDLFGRLGGEEFAIVLPRVDDAQAAALAEQVRVQVEATGITLDDGQAVNVTVSTGVVTRRCRARFSMETALAAADQALYAAKAAGRNRVVAIEQS
ncbi:MAG: diguanylate cyclase [Thermomicrobiales bacterium]|nr:diguanylate cyclase [Thermomicrobiales bacterium]